MRSRGQRRRLAAAVRAVVTLAAAMVSAAILAACATAPPVEPPGSFAVYDEPEVVRAVSPEGVRYLVRYAENEPEQSLAFWREALRRHLEESGYALRSEEDFSSAAGAGVLFEWVAPVGAADWIYLTAVVPAGKELIVAEAAGPAETYASYRAQIRRSLESIGAE